MIDAITTAKCIASCDERIEDQEKKLLGWKNYNRILDLVNMEMAEKHKQIYQNYENNIKLIKVEKLIYQSLLKTNNKAIFPKLLAKYDELMGVSYDISGNLVMIGSEKEGDHLNYCKISLEQRKYIEILCSYGERR